MDRAETRPKTLKALRGEGDRLRVAVDADNRQVLEALERTLGVSTHPQGAIHEDSAGAINRGSQHVEALREEYGNVAFARGARQIAHRVRCIAHAAPPLRLLRSVHPGPPPCSAIGEVMSEQRAET